MLDPFKIRLHRFLVRQSEDGGQTLTEYALLLFLIAIAAVVGVAVFGVGLHDLWNRIISQLPF